MELRPLKRSERPVKHRPLNIGGAQMKRILPILISLLFLLAGCSGAETDRSYEQITQEKAKEMMDT